MQPYKLLATIALATLLLTGSALAKPITTMTASWYGPGMECYPQPNGSCVELTASGKRFNMDDPAVVAHKTVPFGTTLRITNPQNGRFIIAKVEDRGPFVKGRELDVTREGARQLGFLEKGVIELRVEILS